MAKSSAFVVAPVSGPQRARSVKVPPQSALSVKVAAGEPFSRREPASVDRRAFAFEHIRWERVNQDAQEQTDYRPNENAAHRAQLDYAHSSATNDANGRKDGEGATTKAKTNKNGSRARREGEHDAARFLAETAGSSEGINPVWGN